MSDIHKIWDEYLRKGGKGDFTEFGVYLIRQSAIRESLAESDPARNEEAAPRTVKEGSYGTRAAILTGRLERFVFLRAKPKLKKAGLDNPDDFGLLAALYFKPNISKGQLLKQSLVEFATGTEMLKRMKKAGWILEKPNPEDGRSVLVALSAKGKKLLENCFMQLSGNEDLLEVLSEEEQKNFLAMLEKLDHCHSERAGILSIPEWMEEAYQYMF